MALQVPQQHSANLFKEGYKHFVGIEESVIRNINAINELCQILSTSYGPNGRNKLIVNHLLKHFVTSDASTILKELEVNHPAAKLIMDCASAQQQETGDLTNYVCLLSAQSLNFSIKLLHWGISPSIISESFIQCKKQLLTHLQASILPQDSMNTTKCVRTAISAKQYGLEDLLTPLVVNAIQMTIGATLEKDSVLKPSTQFDMDNIRVVKVLGGGLSDSTVIHGMCFHKEPLSVLQSTTGTSNMIAVYTCPLDISQTETKGTILLNNASELLDYSKLEEDKLFKELKAIKDSGVHCIISGGTISELAVYMCNQLQLICISIPSKFELRRVSRCTNAVPLTRVGVPTKEEMGHGTVECLEIGNNRVTYVKTNSSTSTSGRVATILLRGSTQPQLDDIERAVLDGVLVYRSLCIDDRVVGGAGCTELQLAKLLRKSATRGQGQEAVYSMVADALEMIPRLIAENSGLDGMKMTSELAKSHSVDSGDASMAVCYQGVDVESDKGLNVLKSGIVDSYYCKEWAIKFGMDVCATVLKIDQIVMSQPSGGPKPPKQQGHWDQD